MTGWEWAGLISTAFCGGLAVAYLLTHRGWL